MAYDLMGVSLLASALSVQCVCVYVCVFCEMKNTFLSQLRI